MNEIIKIERSSISGELVDTVNARDLHAYLGNRDHFTTWMQDRIRQFHFIEDQDFVRFSVDSEKGRPSIEYAISVDMAKELAMVERNERGRQIRQYFIEMERRAKSAAPAFQIPQTLSEALRLAADQAETIERQKHQLEVAAPKAAFVDRYVDSSGSLGFRQVCKLLGANEAHFRDFLTRKKIIYRLGRTMTPYAEHLAAGRFETKAGVSEVSSHAYTQTRFTPKGIQWIAGLWAAEQAEGLLEVRK